MDTTKIIKGVVNSGRYTVTAPIVKEDYGLYLQIEGVELPQTYEVDFSNSEHSGTSVTMIGNSDGVLIPSQFISTGKDVFAFLYHVGVDFGRTVYKFRIPNKVRPDRTEEQPTPEEQSVIDQAINALNEAVAQTSQDVIDADESANSAKDDADRAERARTGAETAQGKAEDAQESAERAKDDAETSERNASESERKAKGYADTASAKADAIIGLTAQATTLPDGSSATASYDAETGVMSFGIPKGKDGTNGIDGDDGYSPTASVSKSGKVATITITDKNGTTSAQVSDGEDGATGATPNLTIGTVETLEPSESATATITGTPENPVLNLGIPQGDAGEVTLADLNSALIDKAPIITDTASGAIASFSDGADNLPLKSLIVDIDPVQDLSHGDPSPENLCPISGWTEVGVEQSGVNAWDEEWEGGDINVSNGEPRDNASRIRSKNFIQVRPNTVFYSKSSYPNTIVCFYGKDKEWVTPSGYAVAIDCTFTTPSWCYWIKLYCNTTAYANDISINYPSTDHSYHPYTGRSITIELGQTVYGGKLDVLSGELVVDRKYEKFDGSEDETWYTYGSSGYRVPKRDIGSSGNGICNLAPTVSSASSYGVMFSANNNYIYFFQAVSKWGVATIADLRAWLATNNVEVCYELAQPITYHLDPHAINSLYGVNNIWADSGDCTAEYRADTKLFIARLTEPDADMIADANIVSGQYFMVGNSLYKATANIASGSAVIVGTNATRKSLSEALNEINA